MSNIESGHSPAGSSSGLEEKLATHRQLVEERHALEARITRAKDEKDSVSERVFTRVLSGYEDALKDVNARLTPIESELNELRRQVDGELKALDAVVEKLEDELSEARFRHRVGEFDDATLAEAEGRLDPQVSEARRQRDELRARLDAMDRRRPDSTDTDTPAAPATSEPSASAEATPDTPEPPASPQTTPAAPADPVADFTFDAASLMDDDVEKEESERAAQTVTDEAAEAYDPLAALSDPEPSSERAKNPAPTAAQRTEPSSQPAQPARQSVSATATHSYPSLTIRSGMHEGKIVPLLPMTMTIGREHDNSIELKDENVARYHARVIYEDGRFFIEDLDTASGTWVNGVRQRRVGLTPGDTIRIGDTELVMES